MSKQTMQNRIFMFALEIVSLKREKNVLKVLYMRRIILTLTSLYNTNAQRFRCGQSMLLPPEVLLDLLEMPCLGPTQYDRWGKFLNH